MIDPESFKQIFGGTDQDVREFVKRANGIQGEDNDNEDSPLDDMDFESHLENSTDAEDAEEMMEYDSGELTEELEEAFEDC